MIPIHDLLNKIKWDKRENPGDYVLYYYDRVEKKLKPLKYKDILKIEGGFLMVTLNNKETNIPLHRIRKVENKGKVVWERVVDNQEKNEKY